MAQRLLHESTSTSLERKGSLWTATYLTPGAGSSGIYGEEMMARDAAKAFPKGSKHFFKHPSAEDEQRDPRDQWGVTAEDAEFVPGVGIVGKIRVLKHWQEVVESLAEEGQADLSIWAMGESDENGNITELFADRQNGADLVAFPGRPGSSLTTKMFESARAAASPKPPAASVEDQRKKESVEKWEEAIVAVNSKLDTFITKSEAAVTAAEARATTAEANAQAAIDGAADKVKEALAAFNEKLKSIKDAELLPTQEKALIAAAEAGEDITSKLAEAVAVVTEVKTLSEASGGSFVRGSESAEFAGFTGFGGAK